MNVQLARDIWESIPVTGRYRVDIFNDFLVNHTRPEIEEALERLCEIGHLRATGNTVGLLYARPERKIVYTNIRPIHGMDVLLQMHRNFTEEKPR